jgi:hypothetical protein
MDNPVFSGQLNQSLAGSIARGTSALDNVPALLKRIIQEEHWRSFTGERSGRHVTFATFREFVLALLPDGLESNFVDLEILCQKDPAALELLQKEWAKGSPHFEPIELPEWLADAMNEKGV